MSVSQTTSPGLVPPRSPAAKHAGLSGGHPPRRRHLHRRTGIRCLRPPRPPLCARRRGGAACRRTAGSWRSTWPRSRTASRASATCRSSTRSSSSRGSTGTRAPRPRLIASYALLRRVPACRRVFSAAAAAAALSCGPYAASTTLLSNTLLRAYALNALPHAALAAFAAMPLRQRDTFTYSFLIKALSAAGVAPVRAAHSHVVKLGSVEDTFVGNALIDAYSKNGVASDARKVFDGMPARDVVSWNTVMAAMVRQGEVAGARRMFDEMPEKDTVSWNTILDTYAKAGEAEAAFELFQRMPERNVVSWSTVVSAYCKKGDMEMARVIFDKMPTKNLVTWTIMVSACAQKGLVEEAGRLFTQMMEATVELDVAAVVSILAACGESGSLALGKRIHPHVRQRKLGRSTPVCNALMDMFCKCGCVNRADYIFDTEIVEKDSVSWNTIIGGFAMHGDGEKALDLFSQMKQQGFRPDAVTLINVLSACTHMGLVEEGRRYFTNMETDYGIRPQIEHYGCMVDLLGRGGLIEEAVDMIKSMPWEPNEVIWGSLLSACRLHKNVQYAELAVSELSKLQPSNAGNYAVLSNIYAEAWQWSDMAKARVQMKGTGSQKTAGSSWIELDEAFHEFTVGDRKHPESDQISEMVGRLSSHVKHAGCVPAVHELLVQ
ncbi:pentatricopeptide repeat-containing protein [Panicum miliaceum]|uniref:Pentatricopeptide repeat-containing protein n=1 Tax=Panicum miliaceum TaxID=4540 RepID=A0A3L6T389_PANMI|nr:pentatricopeptide repeat-containing protein [Panicum miliaceum]